MSKVAIILPSRGLMFSRTAEELLREHRDINSKFFFSHRKPIPECFEKPANRALLDDSITHLWFVEDDMIIPPGTLRKMLEADKDVVTIDYPVTKDGKGALFRDSAGNPVYTGTGCLLVKRRVFDLIKAPYFTDTVRWTPLNYGATVKLVASKSDGKGYGLHDITFCIKLWKAGVPITVLKPNIGQRKLIALGKAGSNDGAHQIEEWKRVKKDYQLKKIQSLPLATGAQSKLVTVDTPSGGITTSKRHADNLVKQGLASYPPKQYIIIDDSEVDI